MSDNDEDVLSDASKSDLANFLSKVDEIGDLVKGLSTSQDKAAADEAIRKADAYLQDSAHSGSKSGFTRTVINTPTPAQPSAPTTQDSTSEFCRTLEEDARVRGERRKQKEAAGREWKRKGTLAFRRGKLEEAINCYSKAIQETPWVISLYTNRALCYNKLGLHGDAIKDCDLAIQFEPTAIRAYVHKGTAFTGLGDISQAVKCYQDALQLDPEPGIRAEIQTALDSARLAVTGGAQP